LIDAHHVLAQRIGPSKTPYAQRLRLGWVIVGEACPGKLHTSGNANVNKTYLLRNGRPSVFKPCENTFEMQESCDELGASVFIKTKDDNKLGRCIEDMEFLKIMDSELCKNDQGNWVSPLPFRIPRPTLPSNKLQALKLAKSLHHSLIKDPVKKQHMVTEYLTMDMQKQLHQ